ncbi:MAG TPA: hypothetical protein VF742_14220, partial [Terracidiphilus sp.]
MRQTTLSRFTVLLLAATFAAAQQPQPVPATPVAAQPQKTASAPVSSKDARRAAKLFLAAAKLYEAGQFEPALSEYQQAAELDPGNNDYTLAVEVARSHAVT